ncbi:hypothetical protein MJN54_33585, partial [Salmonella enterica subsp. enterica serovar Kentucky]|nr:hypothetical protein [Salmonella enterica subsp. enterica serovar Kentucky]
EAIYRQLDQTTQRFNVGLVAITDVQNARAQYDTVLANEVTARTFRCRLFPNDIWEIVQKVLPTLRSAWTVNRLKASPAGESSMT